MSLIAAVRPGDLGTTRVKRRTHAHLSVNLGGLAAWGLLLAASGPAAAQVGPWPMLQQNLGHRGPSPVLGPVFGVHRIEI